MSAPARACAARRCAVLAVAITLATIAALPRDANAIGLADERELGARFAVDARHRIPLVREPAVTAYLERLGRRLTAQLEGSQFDYRFFVVKDDNLNAFAVPGGYVFMHTGLLEDVGSDDELVGVLAHELVHVHAHHVVRQQEKTALINYGTILGLFLGAVHPALAAGAVGAGAAAQLKYMREFEQEADHVGLDVMTRAGFDPAGMPRFLRKVLRLQQMNPTEIPPWFLSHPLTQERVAELETRVARMKSPPPRPGAAAELAAMQATLRAITEPRDIAVAPYRDRLASAPDSATAKHLLGLVYLHTGQPTAAEPLLADAATAGATRAHADHGRALLALGRHTDARRTFETHLSTYPDDATVKLELGRLANATGEHRRAAALLESALETSPELDAAEYGLAEALGKTGDTKGQWWHLARAYELRGEYDRALGAYEKVRDLTPDDTPARKEVEAAMKLLARAQSPIR
jgi:beta-barrel assembly-enhancing protease